jgi:hypothetical protein
MQMFYFPLVASLSYTTLAQYFPPPPGGVTTLKSKYHEGVKISYKEVGLNSRKFCPNICDLLIFDIH